MNQPKTPTYYLAVDIGATSGRHILAHLENGKLEMEEIYRFPNGLTQKNGHACWAIESLCDSLIAGMKKAKELGKVPSYMGIDTWGVDFVLLDKNGKLLGDAVGYRDSRTTGMDEELYKTITEPELYERTGIQKAIFNTVYQMVALKKEHPEQLEQAEHMLMIPDYLNYVLTGKCEQEYTDASTTQLLNLKTGTWDMELIKMMGLPEKLFKPLVMPGTKVGSLLPEVAAEVGYDLCVMHPAEHDTGSAVMAVPTSSDEIAFLSSGTWSLLGMESLTPMADEAAHAANLTNEGGYDMRYRCLKNIMGLWMISSIRRQEGDNYTYADVSNMAQEYDATPLRVNVNDNAFLAPDNMARAVREKIGKPDAPLGEVLAVVYHSLADCYAKTVAELTALRGKPLATLHVFGGGCQDQYLNRLTAQACGIPVYTGPIEATAIGNVICQMLGSGVFPDLPTARKVVFDSFEVKKINA